MHVSFTGIMVVSWKKEKVRASVYEVKLADLKTLYEKQLNQLKQISELDKHYTRALHDENIKIDDLHSRINSGTQRLHISANCEQQLPSSSATSGMDDAASPRLTQDAEQGYFTHRKDLVRAEKMILGLQDYIREQCIK